MITKIIISLLIAFLLIGCLSVRKEDVDAWVGQPTTALETHPIFITLPVVKTQTSDGTEIWNYINSANISGCTGGGSVFEPKLSFSTYNQFVSCVQRVAACNNIFYIKNGLIERFVPIGTGGARCYTNESIQPHFRSTANIK